MGEPTVVPFRVPVLPSLVPVLPSLVIAPSLVGPRGGARAAGGRGGDGGDREQRSSADAALDGLAAAVGGGNHVGQHLAVGRAAARGPAAAGERGLRAGQPGGRRDARPAGRDHDEQRHQGHDEGARHERYRRVEPDHRADGPGRRAGHGEPERDRQLRLRQLRRQAAARLLPQPADHRPALAGG
jgi:hypothetical protein